MPFAFNAVELYVVTINKKPWTRVKEVCRALEYGKATKTADVVRHLCSRENYTYDIYTNEEGMYELLFSSQQPKAKAFRKHCCNVLFPHVRQQLTNKLQEEHQQAITDHDNQIQAFEFANKERQQEILRINEEINNLIANRHVARRGCFDKMLFFIKKKAEKFTHTTLFAVNIDSLKNISDDLNFVTQAWMWLINVTIQMLFIGETGSSVK